MRTRKLVEALVPWFGLALLATAIAVGAVVSVGTGVLVVAAGLILLVLVVGYLAVDSLLAEDVDLASVADVQESELLELEREKTAILQSIRDLENERDLGKISPDDFTSLDDFFRKRAIGVMKKIDRDLSSWRKRAEALVAERLQSVAEGKREPARPAPVPVAAVATVAAADLPSGEAAAPRACPSCQTVVDEDSNFCKKCGAPVTCPSCAAPIDLDSNFCKKCGSKVYRHA